VIVKGCGGSECPFRISIVKTNDTYLEKLFTKFTLLYYLIKFAAYVKGHIRRASTITLLSRLWHPSVISHKFKSRRNNLHVTSKQSNSSDAPIGEIACLDASYIRSNVACEICIFTMLFSDFDTQ
jgi:hypothetical protein